MRTSLALSTVTLNAGALLLGAALAPSLPANQIAGGRATAAHASVEATRVALALDRGLMAAAPASLPLEVTLDPSRGAEHVTLTRHELRAAGFTLRAHLADGTTVNVPSNSTLYRGRIAGDRDRVVVASLRPDGLHAWIAEDGQLTQRIEPAPARAQGTNVRHVVRDAGPAPEAPEACGFALAPLTSPTPAGPVHAAGVTPPGTPSALGGGYEDYRATRFYEAQCQREVEVAFDADFEYYQLKGSSVPAVAAEIEAYLALVDLFYARDLRVTFRLTDVIVRTAPFYTPTSGGSLLDQFRLEWNANQGATPRDIAHLMTGKPGSLIEFGGLAYVGVTCNQAWAYGWSMDGANIVGHEVGHNLGAGHCHDVTPCNTMCGACFLVGPNTKDVMNAYLNTQSCLDSVFFHPTPLEPYTTPDRITILKSDLATAAPFAFDVLENDEDGNCEHLTLGGFDVASERGGAVTQSFGTAPVGRDELLYTPPATSYVGLDTFDYLAADTAGLLAAGTVTVDVRPLAMNGYWNLDEGAGGTASDATPNAVDGLIAGPTWTGGIVGNALDFDGVNDHVEVPALNVDGNRATFTAWIRRDGSQTNWSGLIVSRDGSTLAGLHFGTNNELRYTWNNAADTWSWNSGIVPPNGAWVFVALVVEPNRATIYMYDGTLTSAVNNVTHEAEAFDGLTYLGWNSSASNRRYDGRMDEVRVYGYALTPTQVDALARLGGGADLPRPADGGKLPFLSAALTWEAGTSVDSYDVYLGTNEAAVRNATNASAEFLGNQPGDSIQVGGLSPDTTYSWRVDALSGAELLVGQAWQFELARSNRWNLDEASGIVASDSEGGVTGFYAGSPGLGQPGATPSLGTSVDFDGIDDRVTIPALNLDTNTLTFTAWVRRDGAQAPWAGLVFSRSGNTTAGLNFGEADELRYHWNGAGNTWGWNSGLVVPDAQWVFCALVVEPGRATIHMHDGVGWQSAVNAVTHAAEEFDSNLQLGWDEGFGSRRFDGRLDDVRIFQAALSAAELEELRAASL